MSHSLRPPFSPEAVRAALDALQWAAFWVAVALPLVYPAIVLSGDTVPNASTVLTALVVLHGASLAVGHYHRAERADGDAADRDVEVNAL